MRWTRLLDWPGDRDDWQNNYEPWWTILWRFPWMCLIILGRCITFVGILGGSLSLGEAVFYWNHGD